MPPDPGVLSKMKSRAETHSRAMIGGQAPQSAASGQNRAIASLPQRVFHEDLDTSLYASSSAKAMTSRISAAPSASITRRSKPTAAPLVGGMRASAASNASSIG